MLWSYVFVFLTSWHHPFLFLWHGESIVLHGLSFQRVESVYGVWWIMCKTWIMHSLNSLVKMTAIVWRSALIFPWPWSFKSYDVACKRWSNLGLCTSLLDGWISCHKVNLHCYFSLWKFSIGLCCFSCRVCIWVHMCHVAFLTLHFDIMIHLIKW